MYDFDNTSMSGLGGWPRGLAEGTNGETTLADIWRLKHDDENAIDPQQQALNAQHRAA
jgi:hypothetical protein